MTPEEYQWYIKVVQDRHHEYRLSFEQAEKIYSFEKEKEFYSREYLFSVWEEYDYALDTYKQVLTEKQFKKFSKWQEENIKQQEQYLADCDKDDIKYVDYYTALIDFYEQKLVPDFFSEKFLIDSFILSQYDSKISFLKKEYKSFLDNEKVGHISSHYRHNKRFRPNGLKSTLLSHKLNAIVPEYSFFKTKMDEPTKSTAQFLLTKFEFILERHEEFFKRIAAESVPLIDAMRKKYIGEQRGWHVTITSTELRDKENKIMQLVLMDRNKYGY